MRRATAAIRGVVAVTMALSATAARAEFPFGAAKDGVVFGASLRAPRGVLPLAQKVYVTDADLGLCAAKPTQEPAYSPGDAVMVPDPAECAEVFASGAPASFLTADLTTDPPATYDVVLAPHTRPASGVAAGVARLAHSAATGLQPLDSVAAPVEGATQLLPSAVAYDESGYAYVGYSNSDRIDRFFADPQAVAPLFETCARTSNGSGTRALAFAGTSLFVAQADAAGGGALGVAQNLAGEGCPQGPIGAAASFGHPSFPAASGLAAGATDGGLSWWLFVAEPVGGATVVHRLKIGDGAALPDQLHVPEVYSHTGRFADLQTKDSYRGEVGLSYVQPWGLDGPGVLFVSDDPNPASTLPGGRIWSTSDMLSPAIDSPADGSRVVEVSVLGGWRENDPWKTFGTVALLYDEQGHIVASGNADASAGGAFTLAYPDAVQGERRFVVRTADSVGTATFNVSPPSAVLTLLVDGTPGTDVTPPAAPTIATPAAGAVIRGQSVTFSGTAEAGASLILTLDGGRLATVPVDGNGAWSASASVQPGAHVASAVARDGAGNASPEASVSFSVELEPAAGAGGGGGTGSAGGGGGGCSTGLAGGGLSLLLAAAALSRRRR